MLAAAILSFCVCGISLRQILFAIVFIFDIVIIGFIAVIINIVQYQKIQPAGKICASNCLPVSLIDGAGTFIVGKTDKEKGTVSRPFPTIDLKKKSALKDGH